MIRLLYVVAARAGAIPRYEFLMRRYVRHPERYTEEDCRALSDRMIASVTKAARVTTSLTGLGNLPKDGGYILYANHQGKYDALGVLRGVSRPVRILMDLRRSRMPIVSAYISLVHGKRIDRSRVRQQALCLTEIAEEVRDGKIYLIFPEGGYGKRQGNRMRPFRTGCFRPALAARCPIVPVALIDSYKPFGAPGLSPVRTQTHFLPPIPYAEYRRLSPAALAAEVQARIGARMEAVLGQSCLPAAPPPAGGAPRKGA